MDKLSYYDILGHLVPGLIFMACIAVVLINIGEPIPEVPGGEGVKAILLTACAYYTGHLLSGIGSLMQPILYFLWGGKPSRRILIKNTHFLHPELRNSIKKDLTQKCNLPEKMPDKWQKRAEYLDALFGHAQSLCNKERLGRVAEFNAAYALHRSLFVAVLSAGIISIYLIHSSSDPVESDYVKLLIVSYFIAAGISFCIARQRAYYFVREVLRMYHIQGR